LTKHNVKIPATPRCEAAENIRIEAGSSRRPERRPLAHNTYTGRAVDSGFKIDRLMDAK
jgi:hypothetical protein